MTSSMRNREGETIEIPITDMVEMSQFWPIPITDPIIGGTIFVTVEEICGQNVLPCIVSLPLR